MSGASTVAGLPDNIAAGARVHHYPMVTLTGQ
jgi:hypothetical protein